MPSFAMLMIHCQLLPLSNEDEYRSLIDLCWFFHVCFYLVQQKIDTFLIKTNLKIGAVDKFFGTQTQMNTCLACLLARKE